MRYLLKSFFVSSLHTLAMNQIKQVVDDNEGCENNDSPRAIDEIFYRYDVHQKYPVPKCLHVGLYTSI